MTFRYWIKCRGIWHWEEQPAFLCPHPTLANVYVSYCAIHHSPIEDRVIRDYETPDRVDVE